MRRQEELQKVESDVSKLNTKLQAIENELTDENLYLPESKAQLKQHLEDQKTFKKEVAVLEDRWMELVEEIEQIKNQLVE